jgi:hypothetical protein
VAIPISEPLRDRFGLGAMPSLSAAMPVGQWTLLGLRLRCGFLSNGPAPSNPAIKDPRHRRPGVLAAMARFRPLAKRYPGFACQRDLDRARRRPGSDRQPARAVGEAAVGWNFPLAGRDLRPVAALRARGAAGERARQRGRQILLAGLEFVALRRARHAAARGRCTAASRVGRTAKISDRDGDGIPDELDKCPDEPEDKDGFEDEDGCPDLDNDKDGIPDTRGRLPERTRNRQRIRGRRWLPGQRAHRGEGKPHPAHRALALRYQSSAGERGGPPVAWPRSSILWKQHPEWDYLVVDGYADRHGPDGFNFGSATCAPSAPSRCWSRWGSRPRSCASGPSATASCASRVTTKRRIGKTAGSNSSSSRRAISRRQDQMTRSRPHKRNQVRLSHDKTLWLGAAHPGRLTGLPGSDCRQRMRQGLYGLSGRLRCNRILRDSGCRSGSRLAGRCRPRSGNWRKRDDHRRNCPGFGEFERRSGKSGRILSSRCRPERNVRADGHCC